MLPTPCSSAAWTQPMTIDAALTRARVRARAHRSPLPHPRRCSRGACVTHVCAYN